MIIIHIHNKIIQNIIDKYHPKKVPAHITLIYPTKINKQELFNHVAKQLKDKLPITITLEGLDRSAKEHYLYLRIFDEEKIMELHDALKSGILKDAKNEDMPTYIPHISLGVFESNEELEKAKEEIHLPSQTITIKKEDIEIINQ